MDTKSVGIRYFHESNEKAALLICSFTFCPGPSSSHEESEPCRRKEENVRGIKLLLLLSLLCLTSSSTELEGLAVLLVVLAFPVLADK